MSIDEKSSIIQQKREIFNQEHHVVLDSACSIGNGILKVNDTDKKAYIRTYREAQSNIAFFIPASGSGSRMFKFLFDFTSTGSETEDVKRFVQNIEQFAFYSTIPLAVKNKLKGLQAKYIAEYLLNEERLNYGGLPKGLIPFHDVSGSIFNPFQEQVMQANELVDGESEMHFTVQEGFEQDVKDSIGYLNKDLRNKLIISFSSQDKDTDAYCFDLDGEQVYEGDEPLRRPAGHGALIQNLNSIKSDIVLIKNIDNIQHNFKSTQSKETWELAVGLLVTFKKELGELSRNFSMDALKELNSKYDFLSAQEIKDFDEEQLSIVISRPSRVCGMVVNEGAPGGGPFWINDGGSVTKQIVEGVQISTDDDQRAILKQSSHFNPVFIALSKTDLKGNPIDLNDFVDHTKNLVVKKPHKGNEITYRELPGLWNGAMSNWNTLFVEIPKDVFSPVKTALDLLSDAHNA